jgi:hypothetical protein
MNDPTAILHGRSHQPFAALLGDSMPIQKRCQRIMMASREGPRDPVLRRAPMHSTYVRLPDDHGATRLQSGLRISSHRSWKDRRMSPLGSCPNRYQGHLAGRVRRRVFATLVAFGAKWTLNEPFTASRRIDVMGGARLVRIKGLQNQKLLLNISCDALAKTLRRRDQPMGLSGS